MLLAPFESVLNRNIAASGAARAVCKRLAGKTLAVRFNNTPENSLLSVYVQCSDDRVSLASKSDLPAAATLSGTPLAYLNLLGAQPESALRSGGVRIEGDAEVAQGFHELFKAARPDLEEELSRVIGDVAAHQVGNFARGAARFGRRLVDTFAQNVGEYLQEESRDAVARIEVEEFLEAVDRLRDAVDRAEARLAMLRKELGVSY